MYNKIKATEDYLDREMKLRKIKITKMIISLNKPKILMKNTMSKKLAKIKMMKMKMIISMQMIKQKKQKETNLKKSMSSNKICNSKELIMTVKSLNIHLMKDRPPSKVQILMKNKLIKEKTRNDTRYEHTILIEKELLNLQI